MRYLFSVLTLMSSNGGAEKVAVELANYLVEQGHEVGIIYKKHRYNTECCYTINKKIKLFEFIEFNYTNFTSLVKEGKLFNPDLYFFWYSDSNMLFQLSLGILLGTKIAAQECSNPYRVIKTLSQQLNISTEEAIAIRLGLINELDGLRLLLDEYKSSIPKVLHNKIFVFKNTFKIKWLNTVERDNIILSVNGATGKLNKNGIAILRAFIKIADKYPDWCLEFAGKPVLKEYFYNIAKEANIENRIIFSDVSSDMSINYSRAKIHVISSYEEGLPNAVCEAMICGVPSIGFSDCEGTKQIIKDGYTGFLVERDVNLDGLCKRLEELMSDSTTLNKLSKNCFEESKKMFNNDAIFAKWISFFDSIISSTSVYIKEYSYPIYYKLNQIFKRHILDYPYCPSLDFIVTLYNKENQIGRTIESIISSNYPNYQVIVVDDCSTDNSYDIVVKKYSNYPKIQVIKRNQNGGLSSARNTGLNYAKSDYIQFWDADDIYYSEKIYYFMYIAMCSLSDILVGLAERDKSVLSTYLLSQLEIISLKQPFCFLGLKTMSNCFKIYRRVFLEKNNLRLVDGLYMQDTEFNLRAFDLASSVTLMNCSMGEYTNDGIKESKQINIKRLQSCYDICEGYLSNRNFVKNIPYSFSEMIIINYVIFFFIRRLFLYREELEEELVNEIKKLRCYLEKFKLGIRELILSSQLDNVRRGMVLAIWLCSSFDTAKSFYQSEANQYYISEDILLLISNKYNIDCKLLSDKVELLCRN